MKTERNSRERIGVLRMMAVAGILGLASCSTVEGRPVDKGAATPTEKPGKSPYDKLKSAKMFAIGGVGFAGVTSHEEVAFRTLQKEKGAAQRFAALLSEATMEGQLYALLGLKTADAAEFEKRVTAYLESKKTVETMSGCIMSKETPVASIAERIKKGEYR